MTTLQDMPDEILGSIFLFVNSETLMRSVPDVCRKWREVCKTLSGVHLKVDRRDDENGWLAHVASCS